MNSSHRQKRDKSRAAKSKAAAGVLAVCLAVGLLLGFGTRIAVRGVLQSLYPLMYEELVEAGAQTHHLKKSFVLAVIKCESGFRPDAVSAVGARGLMQLMPETFAWLCTKTGETHADDDLFDPATNIRYGCYLYEILLRQFADEEATAVAAYHAGLGNVEKWLQDSAYSTDGKTLKNIPFATTADYVTKVQKAQKMYQALYDIE